MPSKGDIILNPNTQRPIRVGSRTWLNLVKQGVLGDEEYSDNNIIENEYSTIPEEQLEERIKSINEKLPIGTQAVRGRGKYANKIVKRSKPLTQQEMTKSTIKKTAKVVVENIDNFDGIAYDDMEAKLEELIMNELMKKPKGKKSKSKNDEYKNECYSSDDENFYENLI